MQTSCLPVCMSACRTAHSNANVLSACLKYVLRPANASAMQKSVFKSARLRACTPVQHCSARVCLFASLYTSSAMQCSSVCVFCKPVHQFSNAVLGRSACFASPCTPVQQCSARPVCVFCKPACRFTQSVVQSVSVSMHRAVSRSLVLPVLERSRSDITVWVYVVFGRWHQAASNGGKCHRQE